MGAQSIITTIIGNVAGEVVVRESSGKKVASFSVAVTDSRFNRETGKWEDDDTIWVRASVWGPWADLVAESARKGDRIMVHGRLKTSRWTDQSGNQREGLEISADDVGLSVRFKAAEYKGAAPRTNVLHPAPPATSTATSNAADPSTWATNEVSANDDPWATDGGY